MRSHPRRGAVLALALALAGTFTAACSDDGGSPASPDATATAAGDAPTDPSALMPLKPADPSGCWPDGGTGVVGGTAQMPAIAVLLGDGPHGVVLAPQAGSDYCGWAAQAERLAGQGYTVASFMWASDGAISFRTAVAALQDAGVTDIAFMGASRGGCFAAALADELDVTPAAVVALGPPSECDVDASAAGSGYTGPLLVIASTDDGSVAVDDSRLVARADDPATFVELDGGAHGWALFDGPHASEVEAMIDEVLGAAFE